MSTPTPSDPNSIYPEQRHAGKVGYGPNYRRGATMMDKISGLSEEIHGKLTHRPELIKEGREKKSGELRRRKNLGLDEENPFDAGQGDSPSTQANQPGSSTSASHERSSSQSSSGVRSSGSSERVSTGAPTSGDGARTEAAAVSPPAGPKTETATSRLAQARSQGVKALTEAQESSL